MDIKKLAPWNWFKNEEADEAKTLPVKKSESSHYTPLVSLHKEIDRIFENAFQSFGRPFSSVHGPRHGTTESLLLKPNVDIALTDKEYTITVEVPGVNENNVKLELTDDTLIIKGEKRLESEQKDKEYYRIERSYGSFQRTLTLPEDADQENIDAKFKDGVLTICMPRKEAAKPKGKLIDIKKVA